MKNDSDSPFAGLIGKWAGNRGMDVAPEPDGPESNAYSETIVYQPVGDVTNAEEQTLWAVHYHQLVTRTSDGVVFHNETGYWMWEPSTGRVMNSLLIPRAVGLLAAGSWKTEGDNVVMEVSAELGNADWGVIQSPFMREKASTRAFRRVFRLGKDSLSYSQNTIVDIYGKTFDHTDENTLERV